MNQSEGKVNRILSCHACAYAHPLRVPFDEWIWCDFPQDGQVLNLSRNAECRRPNGGKVRSTLPETDRDSNSGSDIDSVR